MLEKIVDNPKLQKNLVGFAAGHTLFLEGDTSQDLYILVSGQLEVLKGDKVIAELAEKGSFFGEMSFLLGTRRTSTVRARSEGSTVRIPRDELASFLDEFPAAGREITRVLARRLDETSRVLYGLKEFSDQLPDAVIITDQSGNILSCNAAAEQLYGRQSSHLRSLPMEKLYDDAEEFRRFFSDARSQQVVKEKILMTRHPQKGTRFISTSTTALRDGHRNFQGILALGRDVTASKNMERRYRRIRFWSVLSVTLAAVLGAAVFYGYPYFARGQRSAEQENRALRDQIEKDYLVLTSLLAKPVADGNSRKINRIMNSFVSICKTTAMPYAGLVLLDFEKTAAGAWSCGRAADSTGIVGSSYGGIAFRGDSHSPHRILTLYRKDKEHPMGQKGTEIAFQLESDNRLLGWLVFQMDMDRLRQEYGIDGEYFKKITFKKP